MTAAGTEIVLCVDDSADFLETLSATLQEDGHEIVTARSGEEALELLGSVRVDCIVLDVGMPGLDGYQTCRRVKEAPALRDVPLVLLTSREERSAVLQGLDAGADDYIPKSSAPDVLRARVRAQLRRKRVEAEARFHARARMVLELEAKNEELERARDEANRLSHVKSRFLASMSHELRTPLNAIIGFSQLLQEEQVAGELQAKQKEFVGYIASSGRHLLQLINDILDLSSVEAGRLTLRPSVIDVPELVEDVGETLQPLAQQGRVTLAMEVDPSLPRLRADRVRLRQILFNLLSNGIKFTPAGGAVTLRATREGARAIFAVADTGVGIAAADQGRLFREFERLDGEDRIDVTGLGLALTKRLVELHGGTIEVHSAAGQGSTFRVALPVDDEEPRGGSAS